MIGLRRATNTRERAIRRGLVGGAVLVVVGSLVPVPFVVLSPGPTFNTIGSYDGKPLIEISGTTTYPTEGHLDMTTVSERGGSSGGVYSGEVIAAYFQRQKVVVPRDSMYPPDKSGAQVRSENSQSFETSQSDAIGAALDELGIPAHERVVAVGIAGGSPADGIVVAGDEIVAVNGQAVDTPEQVGRIVRTGEIGDTVDLEVIRDVDGKTEHKSLKVVTEANPDAERAGKPYLGVSVGPIYAAPFTIDFTLKTVGGPSAGLMFSLAIVDMLTDGKMNGGGFVAGTGTITPDGKVGPIGGIAHKLVGAHNAGAKLFLAPESNCDEVRGNIPDGMAVVPVKNLSQARKVVENWAKDKTAPLGSCPAT